MNQAVEEASRVATSAEALLLLPSAKLSEGYFYASVPLCIIDAVYSVGVRYESVEAVVRRYCDWSGLPRIRSDPAVLPSRNAQESVSAFCDRFKDVGLATMTADVFVNRQRTSSKHGILKSDAVFRFASVLREHGIEHFQDVPAASNNAALERAIRTIPGQGSGVSLQYFWMLSGSEEFIKPDRMVLRFLSGALGRAVTTVDAPRLLTGAVVQLKPKYPHLTARLLDHAIWQYQRQLLDSLGRGVQPAGELAVRTSDGVVFAFYRSPKGEVSNGALARVYPGGSFKGLDYESLLKLGTGRHRMNADEMAPTQPGTVAPSLTEREHRLETFRYTLFGYEFGVFSEDDVLLAACSVMETEAV